MRIERLSETRIRVTLTSADLLGLDINIEQLRPDSKELHSFLFNIMETIKAETDFNPYNGQVVVEAMPSNDGISIIVSKIHGMSPGNIIKPPAGIKSVKPRIKKKETEIFRFECMDDLCGALIEIDNELLKESSLYKLDNTFCLLTDTAGKYPVSKGVLEEYAIGDKSCGLLKENFVREHGVLIAEKEKLINMADGVRNLQ